MNSHCPSMFNKSYKSLIFLIGLIVLSTDAKVLPDPIIGERCEEMASRRKEKYQYKQRIYELLTRNRNLRAQTPPQKEKLNRHLYKIHNDLNQRRHLIEAQILNLEEEIIRKGCPGLPVGDLKEGHALDKMDRTKLNTENLEKKADSSEIQNSGVDTPEIKNDASPAEISFETEQLLNQDTNITPENERAEKNDTGTTP